MDRDNGRDCRPFPTIGQQIEQWSDDDFTGRSFELHLFEEYINDTQHRKEKIINLYGTGGMGKTRLLAQYRKLANLRGIPFAHIDMNDYYMSDTEAICLQLTGQIAGGFQPSNLPIQEQCVLRLNTIASRQQIVLAFDHYERAGSIDKWLRESFIPGLHTGVLIVIAGRYPLEGSWRVSAAWQKLIVPLPVAELTYDETGDFARNVGIADEQLLDTVWLKTLGHPLTLTLYAPIAARSGASSEPAYMQDSTFEAIVEQWFRETPSDDLRNLIMTASIPRSFNQEFLSLLTEKEVPLRLFDQLIRLSFIYRSARGWQMHELVKETIRQTFREIMPDTFEKQRNLTVQLYYKRIIEAANTGQDTAWEVAEILPHTNNPILRAHFRHSKGSTNFIEAVTEANMEEVERYMELRLQQNKSWKIVCADPESGASFRYKLPQELSVSRLRTIQLKDMLRLGGNLQLLRNPHGRMTGLVAAMPIHELTLDFLKSCPVSGPYFNGLSPAELKAYRTVPEQPAGTYLFTIDVENLEQNELRSDVVRILFEFIMLRRVLLLSLPPHEFYTNTYLSYGFQAVTGSEHYEYDAHKPAFTYILDTSGDKLFAFINNLLKGSMNAMNEALPSIDKNKNASFAPFPNFTQRENEVAELLVRGRTNLEIAAALYISEAAVKKHVQSMLQKTGLRNRTQLTGAILELHK